MVHCFYEIPARQKDIKMRLKLVALLAILFSAFFVSVNFAKPKRIWRPATVEFSNGQKAVGKIHITNNQMKVFLDSKDRYYNVPVKALKRIDVVIEKQHMDKKWIFREDGRDEKVYTGEVYPIRRFQVRATFGNDKKVQGPPLARMVVFEDREGNRRRLAIKRKMQGKVGEKLENLVYPKSIAFTDDAAGALGSIRGTLYTKGDEVALHIIALHRESDTSIRSAVKRGGQFQLTECMSGTQDLFVVTNDHIYGYFSNEKDKGASRLDAAVMNHIENWKSNVRSVFEVEKPIYGAGNKEECFVLVQMVRRGNLEFSDPKKWAWVEKLRRYEIWHLKRRGDQWTIVKRHFILRKLCDSAEDPPQTVVVSPNLGGHKITAKNPDLDLALKLRQTNEKPIPPAPVKTRAKE
ncbi:MAG: hypothetical protein ACLFWL_00840 [Candidatus Brocadiia bacterium]